MIKVEPMGVSPSQAKSKKEICPEESTSKKAHEFGSEYLLTELSENKHLCGNAVTQNESADIPAGVSCSGIHEPSSEYVAKNSSPEHFCKGGSGCNHTDENFCQQETLLGKTDDYGSEYVCKETSEEKQQSGAEIVQHVEDARTIFCGLPAENLQPFSKGLSKNAITESLGLLPEELSKCVKTDELSCSQIGSSEPTIDVASGNICKELGEPPEQQQQQQLDIRSLPNVKEKSTTAVSTNVFTQALQLDPEEMNNSDCGEHLQSLPEGVSNVIWTSKGSLLEPEEFALVDPRMQQSMLPSGAEQEVEMPKILAKHSARCKTSRRLKKKYMLRSLRSSDRDLRSKSQGKTKATKSSNNLPDASSSEQQRKKGKRRRAKGEVADEYLRIRAHLRYLLNRINYEQSLIAAYSTEGWKGLSLEKLKPEKELQRATSEILRRKLKIRDLFQHIDSLCAEGRLPESLFDAEGQIDSEDIFCSKCGSKDLSANNDIILCDGACDRGFHQYCLQPPLLKEDIPPDDEGWLCPVCDCKVDCIELVNESQGTSFSITDSWEKVFPEAAVALAGQNQDPNFGLHSDDSDDNDYNPGGSETDEKDHGNESSSDESDFTSTSEELEVPADVDPYLGLPSDDSEDDDFDPDNVVKPESSSSDFTSDSEDLGAMLDDSTSQKDEGPLLSSALRGGKVCLNDELLSITETASGQDGSAVSKKRSIKRLDYKRLYDETYGNVPSSSSDDEDWSDTMGPRKRKKHTAKADSVAANGNVSASRSVLISDGLIQNPEDTEHKRRRTTRQRSKLKDTTDSVAAESQGVTFVSGSSGKKAGSSTYKRLGEAVKQRLHNFFKENQYPDRATKESLAKELGMTFQQVSKWFDNTRWSYNNSPSISAKNVSENNISPAPPKKGD